LQGQSYSTVIIATIYVARIMDGRFPYDLLIA
jgi:hypothetical protein